MCVASRIQLNAAWGELELTFKPGSAGEMSPPAEYNFVEWKAFDKTGALIGTGTAPTDDAACWWGTLTAMSADHPDWHMQRDGLAAMYILVSRQLPSLDWLRREKAQMAQMTKTQIEVKELRKQVIDLNLKVGALDHKIVELKAYIDGLSPRERRRLNIVKQQAEWAGDSADADTFRQASAKTITLDLGTPPTDEQYQQLRSYLKPIVQAKSEDARIPHPLAPSPYMERGNRKWQNNVEKSNILIIPPGQKEGSFAHAQDIRELHDDQASVEDRFEEAKAESNMRIAVKVSAAMEKQKQAREGNDSKSDVLRLPESGEQPNKGA